MLREALCDTWAYQEMMKAGREEGFREGLEKGFQEGFDIRKARRSTPSTYRCCSSTFP